ncbi:hypothetical protein EKD16_06690 [Streptomonospora litoralis]|uniref:Uncharacterized protein n=1 Tax=Streptomonospora litoralis TaxID=2498135 RepID=A0A4P6PYA9_9ACTN|nr:hypothetical protein EKD16_06690 [Streptomonospora litoralis]
MVCPPMPESPVDPRPPCGGDGPRSAPNGAKTPPASTFRAPRGHRVRRRRPQNGHRPPKADPIGRRGPGGRARAPRATCRRPRPPIRRGRRAGTRDRATPRGASDAGARARSEHGGGACRPGARYVRRAGAGRGSRSDRGRIPKKRRWISSSGHDRRAALRHNGPASASRLPGFLADPVGWATGGHRNRRPRARPHCCRRRPSPTTATGEPPTRQPRTGPTAVLGARRSPSGHPPPGRPTRPPSRPEPPPAGRRHRRCPLPRLRAPARRRPRCPLLPVDQPAARPGARPGKFGQVRVADGSRTARPPMRAGPIQHFLNTA